MFIIRDTAENAIRLSPSISDIIGIIDATRGTQRAPASIPPLASPTLRPTLLDRLLFNAYLSILISSHRNADLSSRFCKIQCSALCLPPAFSLLRPRRRSHSRSHRRGAGERKINTSAAANPISYGNAAGNPFRRGRGGVGRSRVA